MRIAAVAIALSALSSTAYAQQQQPEVREKVIVNEKARVRGGFSLGGGLVTGQNVDVGGTGSIALRLGAQLNRYFAIQYQNAPTAFAFVPHEQNASIVGFIDTNSVLAAFDLGDHFEVGAGPSLDFAWLGGCDVSTVRCDTSRGVAGGLHGRAALLIGSRDPETGRRVGFAVGLDAHPVIFPNADPVLLLNLNLGMEVF